MYKEFYDIESFIEEIRNDKNPDGIGNTVKNRFPIRFLLFDNFRDASKCIDALICDGVSVMQQMKDWCDSEYPDTMISYSSLARKIENFARKNNSERAVITPFSELVRFYENETHTNFDSLIQTIKSIEASHTIGLQRIYIPIIGLEGKMAKFFDDSQSYILYLKSDDKEFSYHLLLIDRPDKFGVQGLESQYTIVDNVTNWLTIWDSEEVKKNIISTSHAIFVNARNARADNAFNYTIIQNVYEFLIKGLHLDFAGIIYKEKDESYWERLANEIDIRCFSFENYFNKTFGIYDLSTNIVFLDTWFKTEDTFKRWLLSMYYIMKFCDQGYICHALQNSKSYSNQDFVTSLALTIFDMEENDEIIATRKEAMICVAKSRMELSEESQSRLKARLENLAIVSTCGVTNAIRYLTPLTKVEKELLIKWYSNDQVKLDEIKDIYPELFYYLQKTVGTIVTDCDWILDYFDKYKIAKAKNIYTNDIKSIIAEKNADASTFCAWKDMFKTVRTILCNRHDIDNFFWIDGLGVDWVPFIQKIVERHRSENFFVNEVMIARSLLPTRTSNNKDELKHLVLNGILEKQGDIDAYAHKSKSYPNYIIDELQLVTETVDEIIQHYAGKKVAIISDHGISYLPQLCRGMNMGGVESDHTGRIAVRTNMSNVTDDKYITLDDGKTLCALRHESLCAKVANGQGAHGGCSPEEILVPIIIISDQANNSNYSVRLISDILSDNNPIAKFNIIGLTGIDIPTVFYNGKQYELISLGNCNYQSTRLTLSKSVKTLEVQIGCFKKTFSNISIEMGADENDLF